MTPEMIFETLAIATLREARRVPLRPEAREQEEKVLDKGLRTDFADRPIDDVSRVAVRRSKRSYAPRRIA